MLTAPSSPKTVNQSDHCARDVTIPTSGSVTSIMRTVGDAPGEPDGEVTVSISFGSGHRTVAAYDTVVTSDRRSLHPLRPTTWDRYKLNPKQKPDNSAKVSGHGVYVRPWPEDSILIGDRSFGLPVHVKNPKRPAPYAPSSCTRRTRTR